MGLLLSEGRVRAHTTESLDIDSVSISFRALSPASPFTVKGEKLKVRNRNHLSGPCPGSWCSAPSHLCCFPVEGTEALLVLSCKHLYSPHSGEQKKKGLFSVSHVQLMSRCAGAGREHSQTASPSRPVEVFHNHRRHAQYINGSWPGGRNPFPWVWNFTFPWV